MQGAGLPARPHAPSRQHPASAEPPARLLVSWRCFGTSFLCLIPHRDELQEGQAEGFALKNALKKLLFSKRKHSNSPETPVSSRNKPSWLLPSSAGTFSVASTPPTAHLALQCPLPAPVCRVWPSWGLCGAMVGAQRRLHGLQCCMGRSGASLHPAPTMGAASPCPRCSRRCAEEGAPNGRPFGAHQSSRRGGTHAHLPLKVKQRIFLF